MTAKKIIVMFLIFFTTVSSYAKEKSKTKSTLTPTSTSTSTSTSATKILSKKTATTSTSTSTPTLTPTPQDIFVAKKINQFMKENNIPGVAVELYVNGKLHEYYYGYADSEKKDPVINKTIFELGGISKIMTSILFAQEIDWAKMSLADPLTKHVKDLPNNFDKMTLQDLAINTSGLPFSSPTKILTKEELKKYLNNKLINVQANQQWKNSNFGFGLLGVALEDSTESEFHDLYRRHILNPLKMVNGVTIPNAYNKYYSQGHDANGNPVSRIEPGIFSSVDGIKASAIDMQNFLSAAIGLPGTPPRVFYPMRMTQSVYAKIGNEYQGLGWMIHKIDRNNIHTLMNANDYYEKGAVAIQEIYPRAIFNGDTLIDKTGSTKGFRSYIAVIPNQQSGIVVLANKNISHAAIVKTAREILFKTTKLN